MLCLRGAYHGRKTLEPADLPVFAAAGSGQLCGGGGKAGGRGAAGRLLRRCGDGRLLWEKDLGTGRGTDAGGCPASGPAKGRVGGGGRGLRLRRGSAEPEHWGHVCPAGFQYSLLWGIWGLLYYGGDTVAGRYGRGLRRGPYGGGADLLPLLHGGEAVSDASALRQPAFSYCPVDGHGGGVLHSGGPGGGTVYHPCDPGTHRGSGCDGHDQHGRGHGTGGLRHPAGGVPGHRHRTRGL